MVGYFLDGLGNMPQIGVGKAQEGRLYHHILRIMGGFHGSIVNMGYHRWLHCACT